MLNPLYACTVPESMLTLLSTEKAWSPKIGGNDSELVQWCSLLPLRNGMHAVSYSQEMTVSFNRG